ncbi:MAG: HAMP domain-containing histidine kinase [Oscillospiraceae bacterium]|jgi:signal transduction histidine kinase|nr:HAMP domain-containing histidine kinase [Oscillospiraceae bacterium]
MRKTIFLRYFLRSVILLTVSMLALTAAFVAGASRILSAQQESKMQTAAQQVGAYIVPRVTLLQGRLRFTEEIRNALPLMASLGDLHISIHGTDGSVLLDSGDLRPDVSATISFPLVINVQTLSGFTKITVGNVVVSSYPNKQLMREFMRSCALMSVIIVLLSGVTAYISARRQTRPLRQMAACARSFERGDFSARADVERLHDGEIHDLAQAFNGMAETLQRGEELRRGFIANVSHELKTPMTTISGFIGGVLDGTVPEEKRGETLQIIKDEVMRLSRLVESTANLSRLQTGQLELYPRTFDIAELSLRILLGFEQRVEEKGLAVKLDVPEPETLYVHADPDSITQVLTNLLDNAVKFSEPGGELGLAIRPLAGKARVSVISCGPTIPPGDLPYVFDRFYKADRSRSCDKTGLGLGLFLVRSILNSHDEDITVTSADGRTEFSFTLTVSREP